VAGLDRSGADPDAPGLTRHNGDEQRRCRPGHAGVEMVLSEPEPPITQPLGMPCEVDGVVQRLGDRRTGGDRGEVEDGQRCDRIGHRGNSRGDGTARAPAGYMSLTRGRPGMGTDGESGSATELVERVTAPGRPESLEDTAGHHDAHRRPRRLRRQGSSLRISHRVAGGLRPRFRRARTYSSTP
jgi:hypothetical protein